jgi:hypothetical protein
MMSEININYDIVNYKKFNWYDTQAYEYNQDDNNGYLFGYVEWYGNQDLDDALEIYGGADVQWSWFKTEEERNRIFKEKNDK